MDIRELSAMVAEDAAFRRRQALQPVGGKGDKIFPPTYPSEARNAKYPQHVYEQRQINGAPTWCVLIDSVQSQANRLEECLMDAIRDGIHIPHVLVDFSEAGLEGLTTITSLEAPHRVYDAIFRDSRLGDEPFMSSELGVRLAKANPSNASALLEASPTALLFGAWHSTGQGGGIGAKFARCLVSEIIGVDVPVEPVVVNARTGEVEHRTAGRRTGSRIDPLGILSKVRIYKRDGGWDTTPDASDKKPKAVKPSEVNHGNIAPSVQPLGVTCDHAEHSFVLSFAALRRLRFGSPERDRAARTLLAALGVLALSEQDARGYALRSRCDLVCDGASPLELVRRDGSSHARKIDADEARALYLAALAGAREARFDIPDAPVRLVPQQKLVDIVRESQALALQGKGGDEEADADAAAS